MIAILAACVHSPGAPESVSVQIPRDCEALAQSVPLPDVAKGQRAKSSLAQHRASLIKADGNLDATRECQANQRERFAKGPT